jgi:flagellar motility protein MotE (MotC chaperone)
MKKPNRLRLDFRMVFVLAALIGAGSLFVTTLTSEAPETLAEEGSKEVAEGAPAERAPGEKVGHEETPAAKPAASLGKTSCLTGENAIQDAQDLKRELAKKEQEIKRREEELTQKEQALQEELKSLEVVRDEIKQAQSIGSAKNEEKIGKLVETIESMSPKAAAAIVGGVDERLAVEAMSRLTSPKLGKILAAMEPTKSASLAEKLAGVARASRSDRKVGPAKEAVSNDAAEAANRVKGGEENGNRKQSSNDAVASRQPEPALGREPAGEKR